MMVAMRYSSRPGRHPAVSVVLSSDPAVGSTSVGRQVQQFTARLSSSMVLYSLSSWSLDSLSLKVAGTQLPLLSAGVVLFACGFLHSSWVQSRDGGMLRPLTMVSSLPMPVEKGPRTEVVAVYLAVFPYTQRSHSFPMAHQSAGVNVHASYHVAKL